MIGTCAKGIVYNMPVATAYRLILGRDPAPTEMDGGALADPADVRNLAQRLLLTPEFRDAYFTLTRDAGPPVTDRYARALRLIDGDAQFVDLLYAYFLGRPADPGGRQHYLDSLAHGESRLNVLRAILRSD